MHLCVLVKIRAVFTHQHFVFSTRHFVVGQKLHVRDLMFPQKRGNRRKIRFGIGNTGDQRHTNGEFLTTATQCPKILQNGGIRHPRVALVFGIVDQLQQPAFPTQRQQGGIQFLIWNILAGEAVRQGDIVQQLIAVGEMLRYCTVLHAHGISQLQQQIIKDGMALP